MARIRCEFCHKYVDTDDYDEHCARHVERRPDGQLTDYVTVPPEERFRGSLRGVPQNYRHEACGGVTGMPDEIIRSYLVDPFLYSGDCTFCTGCGEHVPFRECVWVETGEDLQTYTDRLRANSRRKGGGRKKRKRRASFWEIVWRTLTKPW